ncbi:MAG: hypothetical protein P8O84_06560, partial [Synechococcus sp. cluster3_bin.96]|nr:hypothetical protein [Synechococcus sp. cluster3_bin.96]
MIAQTTLNSNVAKPGSNLWCLPNLVGLLLVAQSWIDWASPYISPSTELVHQFVGQVIESDF